MEREIRNMIYNRYKGYVISYICDRGTTKQRAIKNMKTGFKKGELTNQDVENMLTEVYHHNICSFNDRLERFEDIKNEIMEVVK